jgi:UDPglucose--hexose-1-phosphate uridylyltransferase
MYQDVFAFTNDFSALLPESGEHPTLHEPLKGIVQAVTEPGTCRVLCFSPRHDLTLAEMTPLQIAQVIRLWRDEYDRFKTMGYVRHVMTFENKGEQMGASNPHPHGQIWSAASIPAIPAREIESQERHYRAHNKILMLEYLAWELGEHERIVTQNEFWVALVPFWAIWPFETILLPRR